MLKIKAVRALLAVGALVALLYTVGNLGPGESRQGRVVRAVVTLDSGPFAVQLTTRSSVSGVRDWVPEGRTYAGTYSQDVLLDEGEVVHFWLTAAADIDREVEKRTLRCQLFNNGVLIPHTGQDSRPIRRGEPGQPVSCSATVRG